LDHPDSAKRNNPAGYLFGTIGYRNALLENRAFSPLGLALPVEWADSQAGDPERGNTTPIGKRFVSGISI
jgi:hypothetical protein